MLAQRGQAFSDHAKADVGTLGSLMEDCFARTNDFTACDTPAELPRAVAAGIGFGRGPNKVEVAGASTAAYALTGVSQTGARFELDRDRDGRLRHTCPDKDMGGCSPQGAW